MAVKARQLVALPVEVVPQRSPDRSAALELALLP
jgi:hypothetical protein